MHTLHLLRARYFYYALALSVYFFGLASASSQVVGWTQTKGPAGGGVTSFAGGAGAADAELFVGTGGGVFRSVDKGATWEPASQGLEGAAPWQFVSITDGQTLHLFAASTYGVVESTDHGASWGFMNVGLGNSGVFRLFATNNTASASLIAFSTDNSVYRSSDLGLNWKRVKAIVPGALFNAFAATPTAIFIATSRAGSKGVYRSTDDGATWQLSSAGLTNTDVSTLAASGPNLFATTPGAVFLSTDNGVNWDTARTMPKDFMKSLVTDPLGRDLFAFTTAAGAVDHPGISRSTDNGATWTAINTGLTDLDVQRLMVSAPIGAATAGKATLVAETKSALDGSTTLFISANNGDTWQPLVPGWVATSVADLYAYQEGGDNLVFTIGDNNKLFLTSDRGDSWIVRPAPMQGAKYYELAPIKRADGSGSKLFASSDSGLFLSTDRGVTWSKTTLDSSIWMLAAYSTPGVAQGGTVVASTRMTGQPDYNLYKSSDDGQTWTAIGAGLPNNGTGITAFYADDSVMLAGSWVTTSIGFRSTNGGALWQTVEGIPESGWYYCFAHNKDQNANNFFAGNYGVYTSTDLGATWRDLSTNLTHTYVFALAAIDDHKGGTNLFAATDHGVYLLETDHATKAFSNVWTEVNENLVNNVYGLALSKDALDREYLMASTGAGVWKRAMTEMAGVATRRSGVSPDALTIFPNPTTGIVTISSNLAPLYKGGGIVDDAWGGSRITNALGIPVNVTIVNGVCDLSSMPAGVYYFTTTIAGNRMSERIILH